MPDDETNILDADAHALIDEECNDGLVADREELLGDDLRPREEPCAVACDGEDGLGELHVRESVGEGRQVREVKEVREVRRR